MYGNEIPHATFKTEAEMCAAFIRHVPTTWLVYSETGGFDIVLSRISDGLQIGIEAKLTLNAKVIDQVTEGYWGVTREGPDMRAVLIPWGRAGSFSRICQLLGITVIEQSSKAQYQSWWHSNKEKFRPQLPDNAKRDYYWLSDGWHEWMPGKRLTLPDYIPDVAAGRSAPTQLTEWKIKAIKLSIILEKRGYVLRSDFGHLKLSASRWIVPHGMLQRTEIKGRYIAGKYTPNFRKAHPRNYAEIEADYEKWREKDAT